MGNSNDSMTKFNNQQFEWVWRGILAIALMICGYFVRDVYQKQEAFNQRIDLRVQTLENFRATTDGNRFTSTDWITAKSVLDERDVNMDKRITRVEDAIPEIKITLKEIKELLNKQNH
jgi:hypothetical protein